MSIKIFIQINLLLCFFLLVVNSCSSGTNSSQEYPFLVKEAEFNLNILEPSGLAISLDSTFLWTVSDRTNKIYKIDFKGNIIGELPYLGKDLEGIIQNPKDSSVWIVDEYLSVMAQLDSTGNLLNISNIDGVGDIGGNNGLEGICINPSNSHFFLLKEQNPGVLIELSEKFEPLQYKTISFASDYSGITYDSIKQHLWIVSDQSKAVYEYNLNGGVVSKYKINVEKAEGIAIDVSNNLIYIVSDLEEKLYIFSIPQEQ